jgi:diadenosine tetraphosphate (Ap4A) HIT family hydrolase
MADTIFHKIIKGEIKYWKVWEDKKYLAFLTPFPNTAGVTIVVPKEYKGDYIFSLDEKDYSEFMIAVKTVSKILEKAFKTKRVAVVFEGTGVAYVHAKLYPLHGKLASETDVWSDHTKFNKEYVGYITTVEGPKMSNEELDKIQKKILKVQM